MAHPCRIQIATLRGLLRYSFLLALVISVSTVRADAELQTREQFTEAFVRAAHARWPEGVVEVVGAGHVSVRLKGKDEYQAFLDNAYTQYRAEPASIGPIIAAHIASIEGAKSVGDNKIDTRKVFAVIKPTDYAPTVLTQLGELKTGKKALPLVYDALNEDMSVLYVEDSDSGMKYLTDEMLEEAGVRRAGLRALAESNMRRYFKSVTPIVLQPDVDGARIYMLRLDGYYEASTILFEELWTEARFDVRGERVVFVVARDLVLVVGSEDKETLKIAQGFAEASYAEQAYTISPRPYVLRSGKWQRYSP